MKWAKTVRYQTSIVVSGTVYNVRGVDDGDGIAITMNGDYVCEVDNLPTHDELVNFIETYLELESRARQSFLQRSN